MFTNVIIIIIIIEKNNNLNVFIVNLIIKFIINDI